MGSLKRAALAAWLPVIAGAILATYGNTAWNQVGVLTWVVGLTIQLASFLLYLRRSRSRRLARERRSAGP